MNVCEVHCLVASLFFSLSLAASEVKVYRVCLLPLSRSYQLDALEPYDPPALPVSVTTATGVVSTISTAGGVVSAVDPTSLSQNSRTFTTLGLLACNENAAPIGETLDWSDSPTKLVIGGDDLKYHSGAVVGNWLMIGTVTGLWGVVVYKVGSERAYFPGSLILPVLFLLPPTTASALTLARDGTPGQQALGSFSLIASLSGTAVVGVILSPKYFKALWDRPLQQWVDAPLNAEGYVNRYGLLFNEYQDRRQWFGVVELAMSIAVGSLKSYGNLQEGCRDVLTIATCAYDAYAVALLVLQPMKSRNIRILYTSIAAMQSLAMTSQMVASWTASEDTQQSVRKITESIVTATEYLLMIKTLFTFGEKAKELYKLFFGHAKHAVVAAANNAATLTPVASVSAFVDDTLEEMLVLPVRSRSPSPLPRSPMADAPVSALPVEMSHEAASSVDSMCDFSDCLLDELTEIAKDNPVENFFTSPISRRE